MDKTDINIKTIINNILDRIISLEKKFDSSKNNEKQDNSINHNCICKYLEKKDDLLSRTNSSLHYWIKRCDFFILEKDKVEKELYELKKKHEREIDISEVWD